MPYLQSNLDRAFCDCGQAKAGRQAGMVWRKIASVFPTRRVKPDTASPDTSAHGGRAAAVPAAAAAAESGSPGPAALGAGRQSFTRRFFIQSKAFWQQRRSSAGKEVPPALIKDKVSSNRALSQDAELRKDRAHQGAGVCLPRHRSSSYTCLVDAEAPGNAK